LAFAIVASSVFSVTASPSQFGCSCEVARRNGTCL
jgi:hypothetical protein